MIAEEDVNCAASRITGGYGADKDGGRQKRSICVLTNSVFETTMFDCEIGLQDVLSE